MKSTIALFLALFCACAPAQTRPEVKPAAAAPDAASAAKQPDVSKAPDPPTQEELLAQANLEIEKLRQQLSETKLMLDIARDPEVIVERADHLRAVKAASDTLTGMQKILKDAKLHPPIQRPQPPAQLPSGK